MASNAGIGYWLTAASNCLVKISRFAATGIGFAVAVVLWINSLFIGALNLLASKLATIDVSWLKPAALSSIQWIGYFNAIYPLSETAIMFGAYLTAWLVIIIVRWVKSFIPTVAN